MRQQGLHGQHGCAQGLIAGQQGAAAHGAAQGDAQQGAAGQGHGVAQGDAQQGAAGQGHEVAHCAGQQGETEHGHAANDICAPITNANNVHNDTNDFFINNLLLYNFALRFEKIFIFSLTLIVSL